MWRILILIAISIHGSVTSDLIITPVPGPPLLLPDSIFWSPEDESLYMADYLKRGTNSSIFRYDYNRKTVYEAYVEGNDEITYLLPVRQCGRLSDLRNENLFMVGSMHDHIMIEWDGIKPVARVVRRVFSVEVDSPSSKVDLSKQNRRGEFFGGTTTDQYCNGTSNSSLYSYSTSGGVRKIHSGFQSTAGITFYGETIYLTDVCHQTITELRKDSLGNYGSRVVFDFKTQDNTTRPSGLEADSNGNLWVVGYTNGKVWKIDPRTSTGVVVLDFDCFLTGVAFGGPKMDILFVMTASALVQAWPEKILVYNPVNPLFIVEGLGVRGIVSRKLNC